MKTSWQPEIEKKYRLKDATESEKIMAAAHSMNLIEESWVLQKDWIPDFEGFTMKAAGILLRIRTMEYLSGSGPQWAMTLKIKQKENGVHHNRELEMSSDDTTNGAAIAKFMKDNFNVNIELDRLATLNPEYIQTVGLTQHRMYIEKRRRQYHDQKDEIILAIDELPVPLGWFVEIELGKATSFSYWERSLGLRGDGEEHDYGELVKKIAATEPAHQQRRLAFSDNFLSQTKK